MAIFPTAQSSEGWLARPKPPELHLISIPHFPLSMLLYRRAWRHKCTYMQAHAHLVTRCTNQSTHVRCKCMNDPKYCAHELTPTCILVAIVTQGPSHALTAWEAMDNPPPPPGGWSASGQPRRPQGEHHDGREQREISSAFGVGHSAGSGEPGMTSTGSIRDLKALVADSRQGGSGRSISPPPRPLQHAGGDQRQVPVLPSEAVSKRLPVIYSEQPQWNSIAGDSPTSHADTAAYFSSQPGTSAEPGKGTGGLVEGLPGVDESHISQAFGEIDFDGNGFIGVSELRYLLTVAGERPTDDELDEMIRMVDVTGDGQIAYEDFKKLFSPGHPVLLEMVQMGPEEEEVQDEGDIDKDEAEDGEAMLRGNAILQDSIAAILHVAKSSADSRAQEALAKQRRAMLPRAPLPASRKVAKQQQRARENMQAVVNQKSMMRQRFGQTPKYMKERAARLPPGSLAPQAPFGSNLPSGASRATTPYTPETTNSSPAYFG